MVFSNVVSSSSRQGAAAQLATRTLEAQEEAARQKKRRLMPEEVRSPTLLKKALERAREQWLRDGVQGHAQVCEQLRTIRQEINAQHMLRTKLAVEVFELTVYISLIAMDWLTYEVISNLLSTLHRDIPGQRNGEFAAYQFLFMLCDNEADNALRDANLLRGLAEVRKHRKCEICKFALAVHGDIAVGNYPAAIRRIQNLQNLTGNAQSPAMAATNICTRGIPVFRIKCLLVACMSHKTITIQRARALTAFATDALCQRWLKVMQVTWVTEDMIDCAASVDCLEKLLDKLVADKLQRRRRIEKEESPKERASRIVWIDLELTGFDDAEILEIAVIVTDKDLNEIDRGSWPIHFMPEQLERLPDWHQRNFCSVLEGGNNLFYDVVHSTRTKEQVEALVMDLLRRHVPERGCPLGGSSVHCDREVLKTQMPQVYKFLSHRIIDVSTLHGLIERWAPEKLKEFPETKTLGKAHRAIVDIERSIEMLGWYRENFLVTDPK